MQEQFKNLTEKADKHINIAFYVVGGILSLTIAFGLGQCTAPVDRGEICKSYVEDIQTIQTQLAECRRQKAIDIDERLRQCHEEERASCQRKLNEFRQRCEDLACQER